MKMRLVLSAMAVVVVSGCTSTKMRVTPAIQARYDKAVMQGTRPQEVKNSEVAVGMSIIPGLGVWYATDSLGEGIGYTFASCLGVPYFLSFYDSSKICDYRNKMATIELWDEMVRLKTANKPEPKTETAKVNAGGASELEAVRKARDAGVITQEEYDRRVAEILSKAMQQ